MNYVLTVVNNGPLPTGGGQVTDVLPAGLTFVSANGCNYAAAQRMVSCDLGPLAVGATQVFNLSTLLANPYAGPSSLVNTAKVTVPGDTVPGNNESSVRTTVIVSTDTDVGITKKGPAGPVAAGDAVDYVLTVVNNGPLPSSGAKVTDVLPAGLEFVSATGCTYAAAQRQVTCEVGDLAVKATKVFNLKTTLSSAYAGAAQLVNKAKVAAAGDAVLDNNESTATTTILVSATSIPTLSEWALILMSVLLGLVALIQLPARRRW